MTHRLVRKPPLGNARMERLKIVLGGNHSLKQKAAMLLEAKFILEHDYRLRFAGPTHVYAPMIDADGHPLSHFPDGSLITDFDLVIDSLYHCAADAYDAPLPPTPTRFSPGF